VPKAGKQARPVVGTGSCLYADQARGQRGNEFQQLATDHAGAHHRRLACGIHAMHGEYALGKIDADGNNSFGLPL